MFFSFRHFNQKAKKLRTKTKRKNKTMKNSTTKLLIIALAVFVFSVTDTLAQQKVEFNGQGKASTKANLKSGSKATYTVRETPGMIFVKIPNVQSSNQNNEEITWTLEANGKTIQSGQLNSGFSFRGDSGDGYLTITFTNVSDSTVQLNLSWSRQANNSQTVSGSAESFKSGDNQRIRF
jgi:hypothetical protein